MSGISKRERKDGAKEVLIKSLATQGCYSSPGLLTHISYAKTDTRFHCITFIFSHPSFYLDVSIKINTNLSC
jgi:hypothetical protein